MPPFPPEAPCVHFQMLPAGPVLRCQRHDVGAVCGAPEGLRGTSGGRTPNVAGDPVV